MTPAEALELSVQSDFTPDEGRHTRIGVVGSRDHGDKALVFRFLDQLRKRYGDFTIVSGACPYGGADLYAEQYASERGMPAPRIYPPEKGLHGVQQYVVRNRKIAGDDLDFLVAFLWYPRWEENKGTRMTAGFAHELGVPVWVVHRDGAYYKWEGGA